MRQERSYRLPSINILPLEYRKGLLTRVEGLLLLVLVVAVLLLIVSAQDLRAEMEESAALRQQERRVAVATNNLGTQLQKSEALRAEVERLKSALEKSQRVRQAVDAPRLDWDSLLSAMVVSIPKEIEPTSIVKGPKHLTIEGVSHGGFLPLEAYFNQLTRAPGVAKVTIVKTERREGPKSQGLSFSLEVLLKEG